MRETVAGRTFALMLLLGASLAAPGSLSAQYLTARDLQGKETSEPDAVIAYGSEALQFGHLRVPRGAGPHPVLIIVHGGCWLSAFDLGYLERFAQKLSQAGVATWSLEYRRLGDAGGGWPNTFLDVAAGVDHLRALREAHDLDLGRVVASGHSSGGQLALWAAGRHRIPKSSALYRPDPLAIGGVVGLAAVGDLESFRSLDQRVCGSDVVDALLAGSPAEVKDRYAAASPVELLPLGVPQRLLTGRADPIVPPQLAAEYAARAREAGDDAREVTLENASHFEPVAPGSSAWNAVEGAILELLASSGPAPR